MGRTADLEESYSDLYLRYRDRVFRYVRRVIRDEFEAEDLTQDVFFLAYEKWDLVEIHPNVAGFLMMSASFMIKKWFRQQSRTVVDEDELVAFISKEEEEPAWLSDFDMVDFYRSVETVLSAEELRILRYYYEYGYTAAEMAQKLGITVSCFKVRVARMKEKLKRHLQVIWIMGVLTGRCRVVWVVLSRRQ